MNPGFYSNYPCSASILGANPTAALYSQQAYSQQLAMSGMGASIYPGSASILGGNPAAALYAQQAYSQQLAMSGMGASIFANGCMPQVGLMPQAAYCRPQQSGMSGILGLGLLAALFMGLRNRGQEEQNGGKWVQNPKDQHFYKWEEGQAAENTQEQNNPNEHPSVGHYELENNNDANSKRIFVYDKKFHWEPVNKLDKNSPLKLVIDGDIKEEKAKEEASATEAAKKKPLNFAPHKKSEMSQKTPGKQLPATSGSLNGATSLNETKDETKTEEPKKYVTNLSEFKKARITNLSDETENQQSYLYSQESQSTDKKPA